MDIDLQTFVDLDDVAQPQEGDLVLAAGGGELGEPYGLVADA